MWKRDARMGQELGAQPRPILEVCAPTSFTSPSHPPATLCRLLSRQRVRQALPGVPAIIQMDRQHSSPPSWAQFKADHFLSVCKALPSFSSPEKLCVPEMQ